MIICVACSGLDNEVPRPAKALATLNEFSSGMDVHSGNVRVDSVALSRPVIDSTMPLPISLTVPKKPRPVGSFADGVVTGADVCASDGVTGADDGRIFTISCAKIFAASVSPAASALISACSSCCSVAIMTLVG